MAKLLDLLVAAEGFVPVAGRVYAQDGDGEVWWYSKRPKPMVCPLSLQHWWALSVSETDHGLEIYKASLADDYQTAIITAEAILAARGAECQ